MHHAIAWTQAPAGSAPVVASSSASYIAPATDRGGAPAVVGTAAPAVVGAAAPAVVGAAAPDGVGNTAPATTRDVAPAVSGDSGTEKDKKSTSQKQKSKKEIAKGKGKVCCFLAEDGDSTDKACTLGAMSCAKITSTMVGRSWNNMVFFLLLLTVLGLIVGTHMMIHTQWMCAIFQVKPVSSYVEEGSSKVSDRQEPTLKPTDVAEMNLVHRSPCAIVAEMDEEEKALEEKLSPSSHINNEALQEDSETEI